MAGPRLGAVVGVADGLPLGVWLAEGDDGLLAGAVDAGLLAEAVGVGDGRWLAVAPGDGLAVGRADDGLASGVWLAEGVGVGVAAESVARVEASGSCPGGVVEAALVALGAGFGSA